MKRFLFLLRDPGAYAAIYPVFLNLQNTNLCKLFCFGTAAKMNEKFSIGENNARQWVEKHIRNIDMLVCGTGFHTETELSLVELCKHHGVCTVAILDYWNNYKSRFAFRDAIMWPDIYIVMDRLAQKEAIEDDVPEAIIKVLGHPGLDSTIKEAKEIQNDVPEGNPFLILGEPIDVDNGEALEENFFSDCISMMESMKKDFSIKFHPRDREFIKGKYGKYSVDGDLLEVIKKYDTVIAMTTIALLHAALYGKRTISYQPYWAGKDECISSRLGLSQLAISKKELAKLLQRKRTQGDDCIALSKLIWLDGKSTERIAHFLQEV